MVVCSCGRASLFVTRITYVFCIASSVMLHGVIGCLVTDVSSNSVAHLQ